MFCFKSTTILNSGCTIHFFFFQWISFSLINLQPETSSAARQAARISPQDTSTTYSTHTESSVISLTQSHVESWYRTHHRPESTWPQGLWHWHILQFSSVRHIQPWSGQVSASLRKYRCQQLTIMEKRMRQRRMMVMKTMMLKRRRGRQRIPRYQWKTELNSTTVCHQHYGFRLAVYTECLWLQGLVPLLGLGWDIAVTPGPGTTTGTSLRYCCDSRAWYHYWDLAETLLWLQGLVPLLGLGWDIAVTPGPGTTTGTWLRLQRSHCSNMESVCRCSPSAPNTLCQAPLMTVAQLVTCHQDSLLHTMGCYLLRALLSSFSAMNWDCKPLLHSWQWRADMTPAKLTEVAVNTGSHHSGGFSDSISG